MEAAAWSGLDRIGQISVNAHDLARATEFYREKLGMRFLFEVPGMAFFDCGGLRILLHRPEEKEFDHPSSILYFKVTDIRLAASELARRGVEIRSEPHLVARMPDHELWMAFIVDSEGNTLALMSEVR